MRTLEYECGSVLYLARFKDNTRNARLQNDSDLAPNLNIVGDRSRGRGLLQDCSTRRRLQLHVDLESGTYFDHGSSY